ncbi:alpha-L-arabinofuranosidase C-terminal domain-containing protein [Cohnella hashimotonis]|uniref:non-reducing end alpha-L-arabinofuranosidase n=1 Tax=Cohnella hashimotonis TaxID=2826895 RepID=A0ABT6TAK6_9BACL|nr:alpha-L-arabinofuranosidase C-terminal domain-containing protein [Cohnella hashimotonis]MDI4643591.1 alpha-L-arabinofuranosidase C-terminal domain-containing protein [Cohnella hashimotonis]
MTIPGKLTINTQQKGTPLGDLFGIFFEDLNHAADGGLYAELVRNRSFEFDPIDHPDYRALTGWEKIERGAGKATLTVEDAHPINDRNTHYAAIDIIEAGDGVGIANQGFNTGIPVRAGEQYRFSVYARRDASFAEPVRIAVESEDGTVRAEAVIQVESAEWKRYETVLAASATDFGSWLTIVTGGTGKLYLDMVSLFPAKTFRDRPNGLRADIAQLLGDLKPKFMRFPGGCLVHDGSLNAEDRDSMYRWKNTIGDVAQRPPRRNNWRYHQTLGLGYYEYFQFCEDIGAKPIPILPAGYDPHHKRIVPIEALGPWIDDALDLIEFANGDASTEWGSIRAKLGHPAPFNLEYIGIGNEEVGAPFFERYAHFHKAIKDKHPAIKIINSSGPFAAGGEYERGWRSARENGSDLVDEHYYQSPEWFLANVRRYDSFKSEEPKVFLGEYASWGNAYLNALAEAAFMTGLERSAHAVGLACYAPLLCNVDYVNWKPDLIWFNNREAFGTANYYVQQLFMHHQGDYLLPVEASGLKPSEPYREVTPIRGGIGFGANANVVEYTSIRLINHATGETLSFADTAFDRTGAGDKQTAMLGATHWEDYTLSLKAKKTDGGQWGFAVYFDWADDRQHLQWDIGGWQNQDSLIHSVIGGKGSVLTQSLFEVQNGVEYDLALRVTGRKIVASIDGVVVGETEDHIPYIEPLYYSASLEETTGDIIVKVVNVRCESETVELAFEGVESGRPLVAEVHELSGHGLEDENSFEQPARIAPRTKTFTVDRPAFAYEFPKHSVTVIRISG